MSKLIDEEEPAPARKPAELKREIAFWLEASKEFIEGNDEGDEGVIRFALEYLCMSLTQAQADMDPRRH